MMRKSVICLLPDYGKLMWLHLASSIMQKALRRVRDAAIREPFIEFAWRLTFRFRFPGIGEGGGGMPEKA